MARLMVEKHGSETGEPGVQDVASFADGPLAAHAVNLRDLRAVKSPLRIGGLHPKATRALTGSIPLPLRAQQFHELLPVRKRAEGLNHVFNLEVPASIDLLFNQFQKLKHVVSVV